MSKVPRADPRIATLRIGYTLLLWLVALGGVSAIVWLGILVQWQPWSLCLAALGVLALLGGLLLLKVKTRWFVNCPDEIPPDRPLAWSMTLQLFWILFVPSLLMTLVLSFYAERIVLNTTRQWQLERYRQLAGAMLTPRERASREAVIEELSRVASFDHATPFALFENPPMGVGVARAEAEQIRRIVRQTTIDSIIDERGEGFVWTELADGEGIVGIKFEPDVDRKSWLIVIATLMVAVFGCGLVTTLGSVGIKRWLTRLATRMEEIPHGKKKNVTSESPTEISAVEQELSRLENRFFSLHGAQINAIETGHYSREMKTQFFAGMSHDLRSPLNSVIGFTELLLKGMEGPIEDKPHKALLSISRESERLIVLVADILDTSKLKAGRLDLEQRWVPSVEILTECGTVARKLIGDRPIELYSELEPGLPPVYVDAARIRQALLDLVSRVIDSMERGTITLRASRERHEDTPEGWLKVVILDNRRAIPHGERKRFNRAVNAVDGAFSPEDAGGLALGIALARDIVGLHGGTLSADSDRQQGIVFTVSLPLAGP